MNKQTSIFSINREFLSSVLESALKGYELKGDVYPSISISEKTFGNSYYIYNSYAKIRISDHSVTNIDRMFNEEHLALRNLDVDVLKEKIVQLFSTDYKTLCLKNGDKFINFHVQVPAKEIENWVVAKVWYKEEQHIPIKLSEIQNYEVLSLGDFTKKGDKRYCKILRKKYSFGAYNKKSKKVIRTRFDLMTEYEHEVHLKN